MDITQGTIPSDWLGEYCCYSVEWPNSPEWLAILRGVLALPAKGRFWDEHTGNIIEAQNVIRQTYDNNLHLQGVIMACNDPGLAQIAIALTKIAASMDKQGAACCDSGGSGGAPQNEPPFDTTEIGAPGLDPPPEGFDTWEEFFAQKCAVAFDIVEKLESDLGTMLAIEWGSASAEAITAALLVLLVTPIPAAAIIAAVFLLLTAGAVVIVSTALTIVNGNEEELICELYNGTNSQSSRDMFMSKFSDLVIAGVGDPVEQYAIKALMAYMVGSTATNRLYALDTTRSWPPRDCSSCVEGGEFLNRMEIEGNVINTLFVPADWFGMISKNDDPTWDLFLQVNANVVNCQFRNLSGWTSVTNSFQIGQEVLGDILVTDDFDTFALACETANLTTPIGTPTFQWAIYSSTSFTLEAKMTLIG